MPDRDRCVLLGVIAPAARAPAPGESPGREPPSPAPRPQAPREPRRPGREDKRNQPEAEHDPPPVRLATKAAVRAATSEKVRSTICPRSAHPWSPPG